MNRFLLIEDNKMYLKAMKHALEKHFSGCVCCVAESAAVARQVLQTQAPFDLVICDLVLPDSSDGEVIKEMVGQGFSVIVITDFADKMIRHQIAGHSIVDYIIKSDFDNFSYLIGIIERLEKNKHLSVLVVDDSAVARKMIAKQLMNQNLMVTEASSVEEAKTLLDEHHFDLVMTDHEMGKRNGLDLVRLIRRTCSPYELPIVVITGSDDQTLVARYLKSGATDFLSKPFSNEELISRVSLILSAKQMFDQLRYNAMNDPLTGIFNRRYLGEAGPKLVSQAARYGTPLSLAVVDIDFFKKINDTYGHEAGDEVLVSVAGLLRQSLRQSDTVIRFGGEEFVIILPHTPLHHGVVICDKIRQKIEDKVIKIDETEVSVSVSMGLTTFQKEDSVESMIHRADTHLYEAKAHGRNRVEWDRTTNDPSTKKTSLSV